MSSAASAEPSARLLTNQAVPSGVGRQRIALLSTWYPVPADNGRKQRTLQMIAALAQEYDVVLITLLPVEDLAQRHVQPIEGVWQQWALPLPVYRPNSLPALLAGLGPAPRSTVTTWSTQTAQRIARIIKQAGCTLAIGTDLRTLRYLLALAPCIGTILDEPDVSPFTAEQAAAQKGIGLLRASGRRQKYRHLLRGAAATLSGVIVASPEEARAYRQLADTDRITMIENSIGEVPAQPWQPPDGAQLLYCGALGYGPNADAVTYFTGEILPKIVATEPDARLVVTGAIPENIPAGVLDPHVTLAGLLDQPTLAATYRTSRVCVVPLRAGTGTRIKLLEALAFGIPIVTTTKGAEGLDVTHSEHLLIADTPAEFAAATLRVLRDTDLAIRLGAQGRAHVRRRYSWEARGAELRALVHACLSQEKDEDC